MYDRSIRWIRYPTQRSRWFRRKSTNGSDAFQQPLRGRAAARIASSYLLTTRRLPSDLESVMPGQRLPMHEIREVVRHKYVCGHKFQCTSSVRSVPSTMIVGATRQALCSLRGHAAFRLFGRTSASPPRPASCRRKCRISARRSSAQDYSCCLAHGQLAAKTTVGLAHQQDGERPMLP